MSFFAHFIRDERITALHIAEDAVSALSFTHTSKQLDAIRITRIPLAKGVIIEGRVADTAALSRVLRDLRIKNKAHRHVVVAVPHAAIFTKAVIFPETLDAENDSARLLETANLSLEWNIPFHPDERFADVDILKEPVSGMHIHAIATEHATPYITALENAGLKLVALESEHDAIARAAERGAHIITSFPSTTYENILACRDGFALLSSTHALGAFPTKTARANAVKRAAEFVASQFGKRPVVKVFEKLPLLDEVKKVIDARNDISLIPLLGVALRARTPRRDDIAASLLPIGTEEAYEYQKLEAFIGGMGSFTLLTALVITGASIFAWYGVHTQLATIPRGDLFTETFSIDAALTEERANYERWSAVVAAVGPLATEEISFARMTAFLRKYAISGIAIRDVDAGQTTVRIGGIARSRTHLNTFRDALRSAPEVAAVDLPITDAELRGDIPFQITITFKTAVWQSWAATQ